MSVLFLHNKVFDPEHTHAMGEAFDRVCQSLRDAGQPDIVKEIIAGKIVEIAQAGERDPDRLSERALLELGVDRIADTA
jgi:hypothetical protein